MDVDEKNRVRKTEENIMSGFAAVLAERSKNSWRYVKEFIKEF